MTRRPLILVPLDGSSASNTALPAARRVAERVDAELCILYVTAQPLPVSQLVATLGLSEAEIARVRLEQAIGAPDRVIMRVARERHPWLLVMSTQGESARREHRLGSTTAAVIQATTYAILVVRPDMPEPTRSLRQLMRVLLPLDGSPSAAAAVLPAAELARRLGGRLDLLHVATLGKPLPKERGSLVGPRYLDAPEHEWPAWAQEFLERFGPGPEALPAAEVQLHVTHGDPSEAILCFAREQHSDLIAIAWHRTLEAGRAEIVKYLLREASCPLLFVEAVARAPCTVKTEVVS
jgi:nucleotide-binding universal stress UspA family protein